MDLVERLTVSVVARRAMLLEQFLVAHGVCWPGPEFSPETYTREPAIRIVKCSCGAQLEMIILTKLVVNSHNSGEKKS